MELGMPVFEILVNMGVSNTLALFLTIAVSIQETVNKMLSLFGAVFVHCHVDRLWK